MKSKILILIVPIITLIGVSISLAINDKFDCSTNIWVNSYKILKHPRDIWAYYNQAISYEQCNEVDKATENYTKVINLSEENIKANPKPSDIDHLRGAYSKLSELSLNSFAQDPTDKAIKSYKLYIDYLSKDSDREHIFELSFINLKDSEPQIYKQLLTYKTNVFK